MSGKTPHIGAKLTVGPNLDAAPDGYGRIGRHRRRPRRVQPSHRDRNSGRPLSTRPSFLDHLVTSQGQRGPGETGFAQPRLETTGPEHRIQLLHPGPVRRLMWIGGRGVGDAGRAGRRGDDNLDHLLHLDGDRNLDLDGDRNLDLADRAANLANPVGARNGGYADGDAGGDAKYFPPVFL